MFNISVLTDVTTYISSEEYLKTISSNTRRTADPFAKTSYIQLMQTLMFYEDVYVSHPTDVKNSTVKSYGNTPKLLIRLLEKGIVKSLNFVDTQDYNRLQKYEDSLIQWLDKSGRSVLGKHIEYLSQNDSICRDIRKWINFQKTKESIIKGHQVRISTNNGIEKDIFGAFSEKYVRDNQNLLSCIDTEPSALEYYIATVIRSLRYRIRAHIADMSYQSHVLRTNFSLRSNFKDANIDESDVDIIMKELSSSYDTVMDKVELKNTATLLKMKMPFMGGNLWNKEDIDANKDNWIDFVAERILEYRDIMQDIRNEIADIRSDEDVVNILANYENVFNKAKEELNRNDFYNDFKNSPYIVFDPYKQMLVCQFASVQVKEHNQIAFDEIDKYISSCDKDNPYAFISYQSEGALTVYTDCHLLSQLKINYWIDSAGNIAGCAPGGEGWHKYVKNAIYDKNCVCTIVYINENFFDSSPCYDEIKAIIDAKKKVIVILDGITSDRVIQKLNDISGLHNSERVIDYKKLLCIQKNTVHLGRYDIAQTCIQHDNNHYNHLKNSNIFKTFHESGLSVFSSFNYWKENADIHINDFLKERDISCKVIN